QPAALQLRLLQTVVAVAAEKNSTLVLPFPVELLRFLERAQTGAPQPAQQPAPAAQQPSTETPEPALRPVSETSPQPVREQLQPREAREEPDESGAKSGQG
ncbi:slipin family protein, partial [Streptomyces sp. NPDC054842]